MNHIVRLSVSPSVRLFVGLSVFSNIAWSVSLPLRNNYIFYILQWFVISNGCVMIVNQGHLGKSKVPGMKSAKFVSGLSFSNEETFKVRTLHEYYFSHECVSRVWPKVVLKILMALNKKKTRKNVPGPCRSYEEDWTFLLESKIAYYMQVCHDFDFKSFLKVQGH